MHRLKISRLQYLLVSCLSLTVILALFYISFLRLEQDVLQQTVLQLQHVHQENGILAAQLEVFDEQVSRLQHHCQSLEELLFRRARTYLAVTEGLSQYPAHGPLPSRSGYEGIRVNLNALYMPLDSISGLTAEDFEHVWQVYQARDLYGTGEALVKAEQEYQINALALAAIIVHESKWGRSEIARAKNNLAGLGAFDGSVCFSALSFASKEHCISYLAELLSQHYVNPAGKHYHGPHLQGIGRAYASDPQWASKVAFTMRLIAESAVQYPDTVVAYYQKGLEPGLSQVSLGR